MADERRETASSLLPLVSVERAHETAGNKKEGNHDFSFFFFFSFFFLNVFFAIHFHCHTDHKA